MIPQIIFSIFLSIAIFFVAFHLELETVGFASNLSALGIVFGGTLAATLLAYPWRRLLWTAELLKKAFSAKDEMDWTRNTIVNLARTYQKSGIRALENMGEKLPDGYLKTAVGYISYQYSKEEVEQILKKEAHILYNRYEASDKILCSMARLAPALGLTGTIVSLIRTFGHITDTSGLVGYMGIALLSTFYGVVLANLCLMPLSNRLREFMDQEGIRLDLIQEGILDLYDMENPIAMKYKLESLSSSSLGAAGTMRQTPALSRPEMVVLTNPKVQVAGASS
ncbi:chemotaxis protein MotA [Syntrophus gentianae]|uniref:Chemotaxis protein MotA n=1 Tax=Syntrophus gentianae TaxID=43775 RepID=A0A1H7VA13_9BACT|nr:MotA/TolQ/ExbB proton channel family protein [Syntrophus gentianae]SEM06111.1 chemotaxis protein MotA [Syntrophus gentianae]